MKKWQSKQTATHVAALETLGKELNAIRVALEHLGGDIFMEASCEGKAESEEIRLMDGGNDRLAEAEHTLLEAIAFFREAIGEIPAVGEASGGIVQDRPEKNPRRVGRALDPTAPTASKTTEVQRG